MLKHSSHNDEVEIFTEDEIIQESNLFTDLNKTIIQKINAN